MILPATANKYTMLVDVYDNNMNNSRKDLRRRLLANFGANGAGQFITLIIQFASVPLYLGTWSAETYGVWLLLFTIPGYIAISDFGLVGASANQMASLQQQGDTRTANSVFQTTLAALALISVCTATLSLIPLAVLTHVFGTISLDVAYAIYALILVSLATILTSLIEATYRAVNQYALGSALANITRLLEWALSIASLQLSDNFIAPAIGYLVGRIIGLITMILIVRDHTPFRYSFKAAQLSYAKALLKPAAGFLLMPIGNMLTLQTVNVAIGLALGPAAVAQFSICRTMTRGIIQVATVVNKSVWPEMTTLYANGHKNLILSLYKNARRTSVTLAVLISIILWIWRDQIILEWTRGEVVAEPVLFSLLLGSAIATASWQTSMVFLSATNTHYYFARGYVMISALTSIAIFSLSTFGSKMIASLLLLTELTLIYWSSQNIRSIFKNLD